MSATFDDATIAARTRDAIARVAIKVLDQERPPYRYGTVTAINPDGKTVTVQFADGGAAVPVKILGVQPAAVGQVVQVSGRQGDRFVSGVVGAAKPADVSSTDLVAPTGLTVFSLVQALSLRWNASSNASLYEVQLAEDSLFTLNVRTHPTTSTAFQFDALNEDTDYWVRVRALNNTGGGSAWVSSGPHRADAFPRATDGFAPSASPQPVVVAGLGYLYAEWLPVSNADPVDYEVHISTVSGFTPDSTTWLQTVGSTFTFIRTDAAGAPLDYDTTYFVRLIAKDPDGAALPGAQGSGSPDRVETGDAGNIGVGNITDGAPPASSPDVTGIYNGVGFIMAKWTHIANVDPVQYEIHLSTVSNFIPDSNSYVGETPSNWFFIRNQGAGAAFAPLVQGTTYYVKLWSKDGDGYAPGPGVQGSGVTGKTSSEDYATGSVTGTVLANLAVGSAHISDAAITSAKIADAAISSAKIADLSVVTAKIADAAIATAKIGDLAVSNAKIASAAITDAKVNDLSASKLTAGTINASIISVINLNASNITAGTIEGIRFQTLIGSNNVRLVIGASTYQEYLSWRNSSDVGQASIWGNSSGRLQLEGLNEVVMIALNNPPNLSRVNIQGREVVINAYAALTAGNHVHTPGSYTSGAASNSDTGGVNNNVSTSKNNGASGAADPSSTEQKAETKTGGSSAGTSHDHPIYAHSHRMNSHTHLLGDHSHSMAHSHNMSHTHTYTV